MRPRFGQESAVYGAVLYDMIVTIYKNVNPLNVIEYIIRAVTGCIRCTAQMSQGYDQITVLILQGIDFFLSCRIHIISGQERQSPRALRIGSRYRRRRRQAKYANIQISFPDNSVSLRGKWFPRGIYHNIGRHNGKVSLFDALLCHICPIVKFVIAQGHGIVPRGIHKINGCFPLAQIDQVIVLDSITGIEKHYLFPLCLEILFECRNGCHAIDAISPLVIAMGIIGMHDNQMRIIGCKG